MNLKRTLFLLAAVLPLQLSAKVTLPAIFTDNMVLQQQSDVKIWGRAKPGKAVKVTTSWDGKTYATTAAASGGWEVRVSTPVAGGPYTVTVSDGKPVELKNVLIGEVWLCSGQSNMEMRVADRVLNYEQEMKEADAYGNIRLLHIDNTTSPVRSTRLRFATAAGRCARAKTSPTFRRRVTSSARNSIKTWAYPSD